MGGTFLTGDSLPRFPLRFTAWPNWVLQSARTSTNYINWSYPEGSKLGLIRSVRQSGWIANISANSANVSDDLRVIYDEPESHVTARPSFNTQSERVLSSLAIERVRDSEEHAADSLLEDAALQFPDETAVWAKEAFENLKQSHPTLAADLIRCVSRLQVQSAAPWAVRLAESALWNDDIGIREAGLRVLERFEGEQAIRALRDRIGHEPVVWLSNYMKQVLSDLA